MVFGPGKVKNPNFSIGENSLVPSDVIKWNFQILNPIKLDLALFNIDDTAESR